MPACLLVRVHKSSRLRYNKGMEGNYYSGIGSRETPEPICKEMTEFAAFMGARGWIMRSGAAPGADEAFERGAPLGRRELYLPWKTFGNRWNADCIVPSEKFKGPVYMEALKIAQRHHPGWHNLQEGARKLMARNVFQVLGQDLKTPSAFICCWAPDTRMEGGKIVNVKGGTGLAVRMAVEFGVPVYNLDLPDHLRAMRSLIEKYRLEETTQPARAPPSGVRL